MLKRYWAIAASSALLWGAMASGASAISAVTVIYPGDVVDITVNWPTYYFGGVHPSNPSQVFFYSSQYGGSEIGFTANGTILSTNSSGTQSVIQVTIPSMYVGGDIGGITIQVDSLAPNFALGTAVGTYGFVTSPPTPPVNKAPEIPFAGALPAAAALVVGSGFVFRRMRKGQFS